MEYSSQIDIIIKELIENPATAQFLTPILQILGGLAGLSIIFMIISVVLNVKRTKMVFLAYGNTEKIKNKLKEIENRIENIEVKINKISEKEIDKVKKE